MRDMTMLPRLVFLGNSVFLAGLKADFISSRIEAITVEAHDPDAADLIRRHDPTAVLYDLTAGHQEAALALLRDRPGTLLIGVTPSSDQVLLLSGQQVTTLSISHLLALVQSHVRDAAG